MAKATQAFVNAITGLAATFNREPTEALLAGYWMGLQDLDQNSIERACARAMLECKFMPVVRDLRELAGMLSPEQRAIKAWEAFASAVQRLGYYRSPDFDDPVINATVRNMGGWEAVCIKASDNGEEFEKFGRRDFERIYVAYCRTGITAHDAMRLSGHSEIANRASGMLVDNLLRLPGDRKVLWSPDRVETGLPAHTDARITRAASESKKLSERGRSETSGLLELKKA